MLAIRRYSYMGIKHKLLLIICIQSICLPSKQKILLPIRNITLEIVKIIGHIFLIIGYMFMEVKIHKENSYSNYFGPSI